MKRVELVSILEYDDGMRIEIRSNHPVDLRFVRRINRWVRAERRRCVSEILALKGNKE